MRRFFRATYEVVTPESAEYGDAAERGYCSPGGWKHDDVAELTLREALDATQRSYSRKHGAGFEDNGSWWSTVGEDQDYRTGEETRYDIHPLRTITASSYARVSRILTGRK